ncbi:hypothetical protein [Actinomadura hibisca]|uniref:hypothetical protein n=1 Tax=Actinomadura hibisca TaxID=68565 RepID=UPI00082CE123|nr:hypothetical protein [Actinomadura hibisca]
MRLRLLLVVALALPAAACSGDPAPAKPAAGTPPRPSARTALPPKQTAAARTALTKYLRGLAAGDAKVCGLTTPAYERAVYGKPGGCRPGLPQARRKLRPKDLAALRTVTVPTAEPGAGPGEYSVQFEDLKWKAEPARPGGVLAARFTLHKSGPHWLLVS